MIRPWMIYGGVLVLGLGLSWYHYTTDDGKEEKLGVALLDGKRDDLKDVTYTSPDLDVKVEMRKDAVGTYAWVTATEHKQKKAKEGEPVPPVETKVTAFKAGSAGDKLFDGLAPLMAMRELANVDDTKIDTFGLKAPTTSLGVTLGGRTATLDLGGETYGAKDLYAFQRETSKYFVVDDELVKPLKFATTRLPERAVFSYKPEEVTHVVLAKDGKQVEWLQHNKEDRNADWWERLPAPGSTDVGKKDETFANWLEKAQKIKSQNYVQKGEEPATTEPQFDLTFTAPGKADETLHVSKSGDDWYAQGDFTRGLVKLTRSVVEDPADEVVDILEGREPPAKEKSPPTPGEGAEGGPPASLLAPPSGPPGMPSGMPPGMPRPPIPTKALPTPGAKPQ